MRIDLVAPDAPTTSSQAGADGGPDVVPLAQALGRLGHRVTVYVRKDSPRLPGRTSLAPRVTVEHVPAGPARRTATADVGRHIRDFGDFLAQRWRRQRPDVAHAHRWAGGLATLAGARGLDGSLPVVQTFRCVGTPSGRRRHPGQRTEPAARVRLKVSLGRNVATVLVSSSQEMGLLADLGVPRRSIAVVPFGVDTAHFVPEGPTARRTRRPRLLTVAPVGDERGLDIVLLALAEVPDAELVVAGGPATGVSVGNDLRQRMKDVAAERGVAGRVSFTSNVTARDLPALLRSADLLVSAAWDEPFGTLALEAMACGTPVAASAMGILRDAVIDGTTGALVPPGQPSLLARRIRSLLTSPLRLEACGIAAADRARSRYSWDRIGRETVRAYEGSLGTGGGPLAMDA